MNEAPTPKIFHPRFDATFNLGQVAQIVAVLTTVIGAYFAMSADLRRLDERSALKFESIDKRLSGMEIAVTRRSEKIEIDARQDERIMQARSEIDRMRNWIEQSLREAKIK